MLARLRHHPIIRSNNQQREIDAAGASGHGMHESLVPRHIDEAEDVAVAQRRIGVSELNGDTAGFLFLQPISINTGERAKRASSSRDRCGQPCLRSWRKRNLLTRGPIRPARQLNALTHKTPPRPPTANNANPATMPYRSRAR